MPGRTCPGGRDARPIIMRLVVAARPRASPTATSFSTSFRTVMRTPMVIAISCGSS
ncbi:MAG: hypothetical protein ACOZNI_30515 [Myxococcota bacterium]